MHAIAELNLSDPRVVQVQKLHAANVHLELSTGEDRDELASLQVVQLREFSPNSSKFEMLWETVYLRKCLIITCTYVVMETCQYTRGRNKHNIKTKRELSYDYLLLVPVEWRRRWSNWHQAFHKKCGNVDGPELP